jgi:glycerol-3-phosphate dehydrogenase
MRSRQELVTRLKTDQGGMPDVLIVGAGINGIGLYRDLALQGVSALLVDKADFSSGTSAAPSRLIHGGLRYLETGEFALVKESVIERNHLLRNAHHLVRPLRVWVPAFNYLGGMFSAGLRFLKLKKTPGPKGIFVVKLGLMFFDRFGAKNRMMPNHRLVSGAELRRRMPMLSGRVRAIAEYYDARLTHPERLALELVKDSERDCPASLAIPYLSLQGMIDGEVWLRDEVSNATVRVRPKLVVNCAGPWVDEANKRLGIEGKLIGGTRGSHLVMRRPDIARQLGDGMLYFETHDFRACLVYALDDEQILLGTTDIRADDPDTVRCSDDEISYLFDVLEQVLPGANARREEITFAYSGLRPLPHSGDGTTGSISRDHSFRVYESDDRRRFDLVTLVGGKWTTYRACAEQLADVVLGRLGKTRTKSTLDAPIGGAANLPAQDMAAQRALATRLAQDHSLANDIAERLVRRYGSQAVEVATYLRNGGLAAVDGCKDYLVGEIRWICADERVTRLSDIALRRTLLPFEDALTRTGLQSLSQIAAAVLGWDGERRAEEVEAALALLHNRYNLTLDR